MRKFISIICLFVAMTPRLSTQQGINIFWYVDVNDILPGKTPDMHIKPGSGPYGSSDPVPDDEKKQAVDAADVLRGSTVPPGSNTNKMNWDKTLEDKANDAAKRCEGYTNDPAAAEIVAASTTKLTVQEALNMVKAEGAAAYNYGSNTCAPGKELLCQQYKLLVNAKVTSFACARAHCPDTALPYRVHCMLAPKPTPSELQGHPYATGAPCQMCPKDRGYCYNNLCVSHADKENIIKNDPNAVVTCSAPCKNCGERKDINKICSCICPTGFDTQVDCSVPSGGHSASSLKCGPCGIAGTPCLNRGLDALEPGTCRCLCPSEFRGPRCEYPSVVFNGGINLPVGGPKVCVGTDCANISPTLSQVPTIVKDLNQKIADEINKFCTKDQANYIRCCGTGTLPTSGPTDFVSASDIKAQTDQAKYDKDGKLIIPLYATVKGNNGLCRKTTDDPPPIVPIPPDVLKDIMNGGLPGLKPGCCPGTTLDNTKDTIKDSVGGGHGVEVSIMVVTVI